MKNLYERLSPENQEKLKKESLKWPTTINALINELKSNDSYIRLSYCTIHDLVINLNLNDYRPTTISDLFNN